MNRSLFTFNLISLTTIVALLFAASPHSIAEETMSTLSGRVVDVEGNPVVGYTLAVEPFEGIYGGEQREDIPFLESQTDDAGRFSIPNIVPVSLQLVGRTAGYVIRSIKIGPATIYQHEPPPFGGIAFAIKPGTHIEDVEVKVKSRMRMRSRVVLADGTPLIDARVGLKIRQRYLNGEGHGTTSCSTRTDDAGYLVQYVDTPALYTVTVNYQGLSATAETVLTSRGRTKGTICLFTFESEPIFY